MPTCPLCAHDVSAGDQTCPHCRSRLPTAIVVQAGGVAASSRSNVALVIVCVVMVTLVCSGALLGLFVPTILHVRDSSRQRQCQNNLKQIGLALHSYHDAWGSFPPAYTVDANGQRLHSWRVLILPYLGQTALYNSIDLTQPWDSPANARHLAAMPHEFGCPADAVRGSTLTNYVAVVGDKCVFRGQEPVSIREITDGTSNTILVGEVAGANIPWMKPDDRGIEMFAVGVKGGGFSSKHYLCVHFLMCDGSVGSMTNNPAMPAPAKFTRDGNDW